MLNVLFHQKNIMKIKINNVSGACNTSSVNIQTCYKCGRLSSIRSLSFKNVDSGRIYYFPQNNSDIFCIDHMTNKKFQYGIPKLKNLIVIILGYLL